MRSGLILLVKTVLLLSASASGLCLASLPQSAGSDRQERDTSGPYVVTNEDILTGKDGEKIAQVRTFLWEHWSKRKLGHMELTLFSKEGTASNISYEVEPDQSGRWSLKVTIERPTLKGT